MFGSNQADNAGIKKRSGIHGFNGVYEVCLKDTFKYVQRISTAVNPSNQFPIEFDVIARSAPNNLNWNENTKQVKFIIKLDCNANSAKFIPPAPLRHS